MALPNQPSIQLPNVNPAAGTAPNPWANISNLIGQTMQDRKQNFQQMQDREAILAQRKQVQQQQEQQMAQKRIQSITPMMLQNPQYATHPEFTKVLDQSFAALGLPAPKKPDGSYDLEAFKQPVNQTALDRALALPVGSARTTMLNSLRQQFSGIQPDMYTSEAAITPKEAAAIAKMQEYGTHLGNVDALASERTRNMAVLDAAKTGMITQETRNLVTKNAQIMAQTQLSLQRAAEIPQRIAVMQQNAQTMANRANAMISSRSITHSSWSAAQTQMRQISSEYHRDLDTVDNLKKQQAALLAGGMSTDDPQYTALDQQIGLINQSVTSLQPSIEKLDGYLNANVDSIITAAHLSNVTGKPTDVVSSSGTSQTQPIGDAPAGTPDGATNVINGRKVVVRSGKVYYQ